MGKKIKDVLGKRMKFYENSFNMELPHKVPCIVRIDGRAFHAFTKGLDKPFDSVMLTSMDATMRYLCENIQGCVFGYTQSDEISLLLCDYKNPETEGFFNYNIQKMTSVIASMATAAFNNYFQYFCADEVGKRYNKDGSVKLAVFDCRVFSLPETNDVYDYFTWREKDAIRNSISGFSRKYFSHTELQGLTSLDLIAKLKNERNVDYYKLDDRVIAGAYCVKDYMMNLWSVFQVESHTCLPNEATKALTEHLENS